MQKALFTLLLLAGLGGCKQKNTPSTDPARNRYFSIYDSIYHEWGKIPADSTRQQLNSYLAEFPENADAHELAGYIDYRAANFEGSLKHYRRAIALEPDKATAWSGVASSFNAQNQPDSAEQYFIRALELGDSSTHTLLGTTLFYLKMGNEPKTRSLAQQAYSRDSATSMICSGLSYVYLKLKDTQKSQLLYQRAVAAGLKDTAAFNRVQAGQLSPEDYYRTNY